MNALHKKLVMLLACLFLLAGQFAMLAHAADHPFHAHDKICASYISLEHHNPAIINYLPDVVATRYQDKPEENIQFSIPSASFHSTQARAPPVRA